MTFKESALKFQEYLNETLDYLEESYGPDARFQKIKRKYQELLEEMK